MKKVRSDISFPELERDVLKYWKENNIFHKSLDPSLNKKEGEEPRKDYVFYDGPPFATGLPHYGHLLAGTIKDTVGRFFTMKGYRVDRRFGWDCHGVPVEFEIQKNLNLHGSKAIREFGVANFNEECRKIVLRYTREWREFVSRSGRWVDFDREYKTMDRSFMESIWWVLKSLWDKDLVYEGVKCVPYSWAINTPLSNFEANLNYKNVQDPALTVKKTLIDDLSNFAAELAGKNVHILVWTTTVWTLPSNTGVGINPDLEYGIYDGGDGEYYLINVNLAKSVFKVKDGEELPRLVYSAKGSEFVGLSYNPAFDFYSDQREKGCFKIYAGDFITEESGTGLVHLASFGEDDVQIFQKNNLPILDPVSVDGNFLSPVSLVEGKNIKEAEPDLIADLKKRGKVFAHDTIEHSYPFCYRTDKPLIYKSIKSWFVKVEQIRDKLIEANSAINWTPSHIKEGRFGKWLENSKDWAISRDRFWGTPLPFWRCDKSGFIECIGSVEELEKKSGRKIDDLHSHFIDDVTYPSSADPAGTMRRVPQVLDCWFESGAMPFAQSHYPFEGRDEFEDSFPADFIAEGLDQTRGWFYTLLVVSTHLFGKASFKNVIVNGIVLAEDGKKMSKSLKNYPDPTKVMEEIGADAMRVYLLSSPATRADDLRFSEDGVKQVVRQALLPLWNAYNFFVTYAVIDNWSLDSKSSLGELSSENLLDRWILSKYKTLATKVDTALSTYQLYLAAPAALEFIDQLTNWYIRLNRRRFWSDNTTENLVDKQKAYNTLYEVLVGFVRILSPLAPFITEEIYQNLYAAIKDANINNGDLNEHSVHLSNFPSAKELERIKRDEELESAMDLFQQIIILGRSLRNEKKIPVRQPLATMTVLHPNQSSLDALSVLDLYLKEELNIKNIDYSTNEDKYVTLSARLNTKIHGKTLGPKLGSDGMRRLQKEIEELTTDQLISLESGSIVNLVGIDFGANDLLIERKVKLTGSVSATSGVCTIVLDTNIDEGLKLEGFARECINRIQKARKDSGFSVTDRVEVTCLTDDVDISNAVEQFQDRIKEETLAESIQVLSVNQEVDYQADGYFENKIDASQLYLKVVKV